MKKKYLVELSKDKRERLHKLISAGTAPARMLNCARILLKADIGGEHAGGQALIDREIAQMLDTSTATVQRVRERFCRQGLEAALERSVPDRVYKRSFDGRAEAHLIALACSEPPQGRDRWSLRLLADKVVELGVVEEVSHETIRKTLKKTNFGPTLSSSGLSRPSRAPLSCGGWRGFWTSTRSPTIRSVPSSASTSALANFCPR